MLTHLTTNLNSKEIETLYGIRIRSRMREMFNLISYSPFAKDKRSWIVKNVMNYIIMNYIIINYYNWLFWIKKA